MPEQRNWRRNKSGIVSVFLVIGLAVVHHFQFDHLVPITLIPGWSWLVPAMLLGWFSIRLDSWKLFGLTVVLWSLFTILFVEEATSLLRSYRHLEIKNPQGDDSILRVVSLNCNVGNTNAVTEVRRFQPDIILLQESPSDSDLAVLSTRIFGESSAYSWGGDTSIVVNGSIDPVHVDKRSHFTHVIATLPNGNRFDVISLRLCPPVFRIDFWSTGFWEDHFQRRKQRRRQLQEIRTHLDARQKIDRLIIGGDFNAVGNDGSFVPTLNGLQDSFLTAGAGWGNTGTNDIPLFRVDQIWTSANLECESSRAYKTKNSDHRMVVSDFLMNR